MTIATDGVPLVGTTARMINCGRALHRVPDETVYANLKDHLDGAADEVEWYAVVLLSNGFGHIRGREERTAPPPAEPLERMIDLAVVLNRDLHHGGHWVVFWADDRMTALWRDGAGKPLIQQQFDDPWVRVRPWSADELAERCAAAMERARDMMNGHSFVPGEVIRPVLGHRRRLH